MVKNRRLARVISDAGFGEIRRQLAYKTTWNGGTLVVADRWYPSSKTCSRCGVVKTKLRLSERVFTCTQCGLSLETGTPTPRTTLLHWSSMLSPGVARRHKTDVEPTVRPDPIGLVAVKRLPRTGPSLPG
jgi:putative transposase